MARSYRPVVRDQEFLLPPNMADWLPEDHLVWFVLETVEQLDTSGFHASRRTGGVGRQGYDPDMLLGLLLYAYAVGERSSRRIERLCTDHVAFRVLCAQDVPDHTTIARFRAEQQDRFAELFAQVLRMCAAAGMAKVGTVSIDGTKIAANASRGANRSPGKVRDEARRIAKEILDEAEQVDATEDSTDRRDDDLPPGFASRGGRADNIKKALAELDRQDAQHAKDDSADQARIEALLTRLAAGEGRPGPVPSGADPVCWWQARIAGLQRQLNALEGVRGPEGFRPRKIRREQLKRAEQALAQAEEQAAGGGLDMRGRSARHRNKRAAKARARGGTGPSVNVTDPDSRLMTDGSGGGSVQGYNAQIAVTDDHLILGVHLSQEANDTRCFIPTLEAASATAELLEDTIGTVLADAGYFTDENLTAPGPDRLIAPGKNRTMARDAQERPVNGPPPEDLEPKKAMEHRLRDPANITTYKRRSATVETVIAHLKEQIRLRRFARRGLQAATSELNLAAAAINLTRLHRSTA